MGNEQNLFYASALGSFLRDRLFKAELKVAEWCRMQPDDVGIVDRVVGEFRVTPISLNWEDRSKSDDSGAILITIPFEGQRELWDLNPFANQFQHQLRGVVGERNVTLRFVGLSVKEIEKAKELVRKTRGHLDEVIQVHREQVEAFNADLETKVQNWLREQRESQSKVRSLLDEL